jgi:large conductance mechanosensitive channel
MPRLPIVFVSESPFGRGALAQRLVQCRGGKQHNKGEDTMGVIQEFREFAMRGNVVDLAVGVIMGASFAPIVSSLVDNIIMPPIGYLMAGVDFSTLAVTLPTPTGDGVGIRYGVFLNAVIKFIITAFAIFLLVKAMNKLKKPAPEAAPAPPTPTEIYLKEIRDALVAKT